MRSISKSLISAPTVAVLVALLLAGCQNREKKEVQKTPVQTEAVVDSTEKEDTMKNYYERMWRLKVLLRGAGNWESER
ncbi:MAG: hypothetical protein J6T22_11035 [Bacteroidales bacterium]|nr:hypothetical protein [Bacteroidales bacterium]